MNQLPAIDPDLLPNPTATETADQKVAPQALTRNEIPRDDSDNPLNATPKTRDAGTEVLNQLDDCLRMTVESELADSLALEHWPKDFKLSIVIPVFNEEQTICEVIQRVLALKVPKEVIVIDDRSTDETPQLLRQFETHPEIRLIVQPENQGKGAALRTGFQQASGSIVVIQDADLEYPPEQLLSLLPPILQGEADIVYGSRFTHESCEDRSWIHRAGNGFLTWLSNRTTGLKLTDMETCHKAFRQDVLRSVELEQNRFGFEPEITAKAARRGFQFVEIPIRYRPRGFQDGKKIGWLTCSMRSTVFGDTGDPNKLEILHPKSGIRNFALPIGKISSQLHQAKTLFVRQRKPVRSSIDQTTRVNQLGTAQA